MNLMFQVSALKIRWKCLVTMWINHKNDTHISHWLGISKFYCNLHSFFKKGYFQEIYIISLIENKQPTKSWKSSVIGLQLKLFSSYFSYILSLTVCSVTWLSCFAYTSEWYDCRHHSHSCWIMKQFFTVIKILQINLQILWFIIHV